MKFLIVGVNHAHQLVNNKHGEYQLFYDFLMGVCNKFFVDLLAEEMSKEALNIYSTTSVAHTVAKSIKVTHLFCDPDSEERIKLGIPNDDKLRIQLGLGDRRVGVAEYLDKEKKKYWPIREAEWLRRIEHQQCERCLFIVGSDHVYSFLHLLKDRGHSCHVLSARWEHGTC